MYEELLDTARAAAEAAAPILRRHFRSASLEVRAKAEHDFVTGADCESEAAIVATVRERFPEHRILAEEGGAALGGGGDYEWIVDPLDGTTNFLQGLPIYAISIGCRHGSEMVAGVVYEPEGDNLFAATRGGGLTWNGRPARASERQGLSGAFLATGYPFKARAALDLYLEVFREVFRRARAIRRCGAAALDLAYTAAGVFDGFFEFRLSSWDLAAGSLLLAEGGGVITDLDGGGAFLDTGDVVAAGAGVHAELLERVNRHADEARLEALDPRGSPAAPLSC